MHTKFEGMGMKPTGGPAWWRRPYDLSDEDKRDIGESHGSDSDDGGDDSDDGGGDEGEGGGGAGGSNDGWRQ